ncbi:MAG: thioesterase [Proteobacteria bacterium]|nr:MAG: thioesterase [Pseudomonadota bacterium]
MNARRPAIAPAPSAARTTLRHRVAFYETDAMGIVHHANYVRYLELARVAWMDDHDRPYREWAASGLHFATTRVEVAYKRSAAFDDRLDVTVWLEWLRGASLGMAYEIRCGDALVATARTEHAMVDRDGRPHRMPPERRASLARCLAGAPAQSR